MRTDGQLNRRAVLWKTTPWRIRFREFANIGAIAPDACMEPPRKGLEALAAAAGKAENLPYTILAGLAFLSLAARIILLLR
jgi:hypothetical protein